jgi:acyl-coenzyme A synthetase/AMP-(fatty) acid ligase
MNTPRPDQALERHVREAGDARLRTEHGDFGRFEILDASQTDVLRSVLAGASVLIRVSDQLHAAAALMALDGVAARLVLCPPDLAVDYLTNVIADAEAGFEVRDGEGPFGLTASALEGAGGALVSAPARPDGGFDTEWVMFTSGTSGPPKMVAHTLAGLSGAIKPSEPAAEPVVWGTFYDIRRYGGLQILLRALLGGADLVLSSPYEEPAAFLHRLGAAGATHITGTPSHWRRALMSPDLSAIAPKYARLSGEIADQAVLDSLRNAFPKAAIGHAYASTEAGVGFEVTDEREGIPAAFVGAPGPVEMKVEDGSLRVRSIRCALRYLGAGAEPLKDADGFVDSGDLLELRNGRYFFMGRRGGIINVGGLKIHPEEVEAVINRHPEVSMSLVKGRRNPITGAIVVAEVMLAGRSESALSLEAKSALRQEVLALCREALPPFKVPALVKFVDQLAVTAGGKLERIVA